MSDRPTPETDDAQFGTGRVTVDFARRLERQRDAYAETLRLIADANDRSYHQAAFTRLICERHPELSGGANSASTP